MEVVFHRQERSAGDHFQVVVVGKMYGVRSWVARTVAVVAAAAVTPVEVVDTAAAVVAVAEEEADSCPVESSAAVEEGSIGLGRAVE
jgi:hypothetical protein